MKKKQITSKKITLNTVLDAVEKLAVSTKNGFDSMEAKMETKENADRRFKLIVDEFQRLNAEVKEVKTNFGPLMRVVTQQEKEISGIEERLHRVELKVGIGSKV